jgi:acidic leucine-rich nuclear phosphoprotein 32 family protein A/C/D
LEDKQFLEKFINCQTLCMNRCDMEKLENFPILPKLKRLELSDNFITGDFLKLKHYNKLETLKLEFNIIKDISKVKELLVLDRLKDLYINFNPITSPDRGFSDIKDRIFEIMPNLEFLDKMDKDGNEAADGSDDED